MKHLAAGLLALTMLSGNVWAGVVVEEQQTTDRGMGAPVSHKITVMVQGKKQKSIIDDGKQSFITDLDAGTRMMISDARKNYVEMPFPPKNMTAMPHGNASPLTFKKTGSHQKIAGYDCDDYTGVGNMGPNKMTVNGCFSSSAPGASEFASFQKAMADKVKGTPMAMMADAPPGVPMKIESSIDMAAPPSADKTKPAASRPPIVTRMTVSKVTTQDLPASTFQPPKDYTKQSMPMMGMMPPMGKPASTPNPQQTVPAKKLPE